MILNYFFFVVFKKFIWSFEVHTKKSTKLIPQEGRRPLEKEELFHLMANFYEKFIYLSGLFEPGMPKFNQIMSTSNEENAAFRSDEG